MEEYYFAENDEQKGPFSLEELKKYKILKTTLVWKEGLSDWVEAKKIKELEILFKSPPPLQKREKKQNFIENKTINVNLGIKKRETKPKSIEDKITVQKRKTIVAKELKLAGKIALISILIGILSYPIFEYKALKAIYLKSKYEKERYAVSSQGGFTQLQSDIIDLIPSTETLHNNYFWDYDEPKNGSLAGGSLRRPNYKNILNYYSSGLSIQNYFQGASGLAFISFLVILCLRFIKKGGNWVSENAKK
jgi:hypothetical protein